MKILVIGGNGQLGRDMVQYASARGHNVDSIDMPFVDITVIDSVSAVVLNTNPDIIVNCAAYTAVDLCETNRDKAFEVNARGAKNCAAVAHDYHIAMVHISTDFVFDGKKSSPYIETDSPHPLSVYGKCKLAGEQAVINTLEKHYILRISWLYSKWGDNFVKTIRSLARKKASSGEKLKVVADQIGTPTYTVDVCRQILRLIESKRYGLYHGSSEGECSWYDFARSIIKLSGIKAEVIPCKTVDYTRPAPRPAYSVLENQRLKQQGINCMEAWEAGFKRFLSSEQRY